MESDVPYCMEEPVGQMHSERGCLACSRLFVIHKINNQNSIREG